MSVIITDCPETGLTFSKYGQKASCHSHSHPSWQDVVNIIKSYLDETRKKNARQQKDFLTFHNFGLNHDHPVTELNKLFTKILINRFTHLFIISEKHINMILEVLQIN